MVSFQSKTVRAFKLALEDRCEDFGHSAIYKGSVAQHPHTFILDDHHAFERGRPLRVCGNTARMLKDTRYAAHFEISGDTSTHFGLFDCQPSTPSGSDQAACC